MILRVSVTLQRLDTMTMQHDAVEAIRLAELMPAQCQPLRGTTAPIEVAWMTAARPDASNAALHRRWHRSARLASAIVVAGSDSPHELSGDRSVVANAVTMPSLVRHLHQAAPPEPNHLGACSLSGSCSA